MIASFDIESLYTNIPLQETIDLCVENLFRNRTRVDNLLKDSFRELLTRTMSKSLILFDQEFYKQHDGVAMGFLLGPTIANIFPYYEKIWLENCSSEIRTVIYKSYVDDTLIFSLETRHQKTTKSFKLST